MEDGYNMSAMPP